MEYVNMVICRFKYIWSLFICSYVDLNVYVHMCIGSYVDLYIYMEYVNMLICIFKYIWSMFICLYVDLNMH